MNLKRYQLPLGWQVSFPAEWTHEYQENDAQNVFFPPDSDLTVRISAFHAEKEGIPAAPSIMYTVRTRSLPEKAVSFAILELCIPGCETALFRTEETENGERVYRIIAGIYCTGELLIVNIFGTDAREVNETAAYLSLIGRMP